MYKYDLETPGGKEIKGIRIAMLLPTKSQLKTWPEKEDEEKTIQRNDPGYYQNLQQG